MLKSGHSQFGAAASDISVIMPALNEERNVRSAILNVFSAAQNFGLSLDVIVVNDGSTDRTAAIVEEMIREGNPLRLISHTRPQGIGASFWDGVQQAAGEAVVIMPGDGENDAAETFKHIRLLDTVDIIVPFIVNREVRSFWRRCLSSAFTTIINLTFGTKFKYTNGTVIYRRTALSTIELRSTGFLFQAELLVKLIRKGFLFTEVPCALSIRSSGKSKALTLRSLGAVVAGYLNLAWDIFANTRKTNQTAKTR